MNSAASWEVEGSVEDGEVEMESKSREERNCHSSEGDMREFFMS